MSVSLQHLHTIYADSDDPWGFHTSPYEQAKFIATRECLSRPGYRHGLELGCGNGALARHLAPLCELYTGLDAVERALDGARRTVPAATFVRGLLPDDLPKGDFDLIVLSEILYFLDTAAIRRLAGMIAEDQPMAEILCVTWLGDTGHELQGTDALEAFRAALGPDHRLRPVHATTDYRIDRHVADQAS